ncbi:hypothetical protein [Streptomyces sp. bgisy027]|uniref:hypothetical protein n=1 Tax=unclassified Streptomyces TaxID=2593676 RepID=UPI003D73E401
MTFAVGARLRSLSSGVEVVVVRPAAQPVVLTCAGEALIPLERAASAIPGPAPDRETVLVGKRYHDETSGLELLCTKSGAGPLVVDGRSLGAKAAKPLPSSD